MYAHLTILLGTVLVILYTDHVGLQYFRGRARTLSAARVYALHTAVWFGLLGMIATGLTMAWPALPVLLTLPLFILKMCFVGVLFVNAIFIGFFVSTSTTTAFADLSLRQKAPLILSGALSTIGWLGAMVSAVLLFGWPSFLLP